MCGYTFLWRWISHLRVDAHLCVDFSFLCVDAHLNLWIHTFIMWVHILCLWIYILCVDTHFLCVDKYFYRWMRSVCVGLHFVEGVHSTLVDFLDAHFWFTCYVCVIYTCYVPLVWPRFLSQWFFCLIVSEEVFSIHCLSKLALYLSILEIYGTVLKSLK